MVTTTAYAVPTFPVYIEGEYCPDSGGCYTAQVWLEQDGTVELLSPDLLYFTEGDWTYDSVDASISATFDDGSSLNGDRRRQCFRGDFFSPVLGPGDFEGCVVP